VNPRLRWPAVAALAGFATSAVGAGLLRLSRNLFVGVWAAVATVTIAAWILSEGWSPLVQLRRRWVSGVVVGVIAGVLLALAVSRGSAPAGSARAGAVLWLGILYGTVDAVMLSIVPVLSLYGTRAGQDASHAGRLRMAALALAAGLVITAAYHLGFAEFRHGSLIQPLVANLVVTMTYLLSGSPVAPIVAHGVLNTAVLLHGGSGWPLPPHY
jgi:hypothetical protein